MVLTMASDAQEPLTLVDCGQIVLALTSEQVHKVTIGQLSVQVALELRRLIVKAPEASDSVYDAAARRLCQVSLRKPCCSFGR